MFTGLIEETGRIRKLARRQASLARLTVEARRSLEDAKPGDSIAVAGVCLTVVEVGRSTFTVEVSGQTLARTTMGRIRPGDKVNLERAVEAGDRLGGHIVLGHVDGMGTVRSRRRTPQGEIFEIAVPSEIADHLVERGSVAVDGTSLTVVSVTRRSFSIVIIPHTLAKTTFSTLRAGDRVNVEVDVLARYAAIERQRPLQ